MSKIQERKATEKIMFRDSDGKPLVNSKIDFNLERHEFLFGCGAFDSLPATSEVDMGSIDFYHDKDLPAKKFFEDRVEKWLQVFNYGTIPFYWGGFEPTEGDVKTESRMRAAKFLKSQGVTLKGHPLC